MQRDWYQLGFRDNQTYDTRGIKSWQRNAENKYAQADKHVIESFNLKAPQNERLIYNFDSNMTSLISVS